MDKIKIRLAVSTDAKDIKECHVQAYQKNYRGYLPDSFLDQMPSDRAIIERTAEKIKSTLYYVAEDRNRVVGFAMLKDLDEKRIEIVALYVHPDFQYKGVGRKLVSTICEAKKENGSQKIIAWTLKNGLSIGFYLKMGFACVDKSEEKMWQFNLPIIKLEKEL